jgi:oligosaccharide reducing-end xylanase
MLIKDKNAFVISFFSAWIIFSLTMHAQQKETSSQSTSSNQAKGAFYTNNYPNLFTQLLGVNESQVKAKIDSVYNQLFFGNDDTQRVYYPSGSDMGYIEDINNNDVRTEGMSYGMMIAVQLDKKEVFNKLWKWAVTYMQHQSGQHKYFFSWHCKTDGTVLDSNSASDGEQWFVMSLFFASARWGSGIGIYDYKTEAQNILNAMLNKADSSDSHSVVTNMFNKKKKEVVFVPVGTADDFTDPSYHLPHYYELWSRWANDNNKFWCEAASVSRKVLKKAASPVTGLSPDYSTFDGNPYNGWGGGHNDFRFDAWRVAMNIAVDYEWFAKDNWEVTECNHLLNFFYDQGIDKYVNQYTLQGKPLSADRSTGLIAMNAVACLAANSKYRKDFVQELWNCPIPSGHYRYYDGMLYMLSLLQVSGNFRIYKINNNVSPCSKN